MCRIPGNNLSPIGNIYGDDFWGNFIDAVKDIIEKPEVLQKGGKGGIIYVTLKEGAPLFRAKENYQSIRICAFDIDNYQHDCKDLFEKLEESGLNYLIYTTYSHLTPEKNYTKRLRLAIPLSKEEDLESYLNIKRQLMEILSLTETDLNDKSNNTASQVEYLPTLPNEKARQNYMYAYKTSGKHFQYDNTKTYNTNKTINTKQSTLSHFPTYNTNTGVDSYIQTCSLEAYTFEKEYTIREAMNKILVPKGIYIPEGGRYKYHTSNSKAGAEIYDNHIVSFHSTKDPIGRYGNILHAFDACVYSIYGESGKDFTEYDRDKYREVYAQEILKQVIITKEMMKKYETEYTNLKQKIYGE